MAEPVSLALAKQQCRIAVADVSEDALLTNYIAAAREHAEQFTGHILMRRQVVESFRAFAWPHIEMSAWPLVSVDSITYSDVAGVTQALAGPRAFLAARPGRVYPALNMAWPATAAPGLVTVTVTAGYADGQCPSRAVDAMLVLIAARYHDRETGGMDGEVVRAAENMVRDMRPVRI